MKRVLALMTLAMLAAPSTVRAELLHVNLTIFGMD